MSTTTTVRRTPQSALVQLRVKRGLDIGLALTALLILAPVLLMIALAIKCSSKGPVFYKSLRIGKHYQPFYMMKFRTMVPNADALRNQLREEAGLDGELFKLVDDPRVTPVGRLLRASSLDELPQLLNVLKGDMSLVGPRPLPPDESDFFEWPYTQRFDVLPGMTGIWQVSGRSNVPFQRLCELEYHYLNHWSLAEDARICCQTVAVVAQMRGAC
jgi:lipopolysaccharide/colanic/teichoic acid biosynthesis glycosyltransferase